MGEGPFCRVVDDVLWGRDPFVKGSPPPHPHPLKLLVYFRIPMNFLIGTGPEATPSSTFSARPGSQDLERKHLRSRPASQVFLCSARFFGAMFFPLFAFSATRCQASPGYFNLACQAAAPQRAVNSFHSQTAQDSVVTR